MEFSKYKERGAYHFDWYNSQKWYKDSVDMIVDFCTGRTIDVGCGDGLVVNKIEKNGFYAVGMDDDVEGIKLAMKMNPHTLFYRQSIETPFRQVFDYMSCLNVIEHLKDPQALVRFFDENICNAGIIITDIPSDKPSKYHVSELTPSELSNLFDGYDRESFEIPNAPFHGIKVYK